MGVNHRRSPRQRFLAFVMVCHHHIHAQLRCVVYLLHARNAAVHRDHQRHALFMQAAHGVGRQAIAILNAPGDIVGHLHAPAAQIVHQNHGGRDSVHIIIAKHRHMLVPGNALLDTPDGLVHVPHQKRRMRQTVLPLQKSGRLRSVPYPPGGQHLRHQIGKARLLQCPGGGSIAFTQIPFFKFHGSRPLFFSRSHPLDFQ